MTNHEEKKKREKNEDYGDTDVHDSKLPSKKPSFAEKDKNKAEKQELNDEKRKPYPFFFLSKIYTRFVLSH